jgi:hypothetical protein
VANIYVASSRFTLKVTIEVVVAVFVASFLSGGFNGMSAAEPLEAVR